MRKFLCMGTFAIESVNSKYKPMGGANLDGWSNSVKDEVDEGIYDEVFEKLYDKYCKRFSLPPELKLLTMLGTSAVQYHLTSSLMKRAFNAEVQDEILRRNPHLQESFKHAAKEHVDKLSQSAQKTMENPEDINDILAEIDDEKNIEI